VAGDSSSINEIFMRAERYVKRLTMIEIDDLVKNYREETKP